MLEHIWISSLDSGELNLYQFGVEDCLPGHSFGPAVRDHFLIHFILEGSGTFKAHDTVYNLKKGQGFVIMPNEITYYQADEMLPWSYAWIGFNGTKALEYINFTGLGDNNNIFDFNLPIINEHFIQMLKNNRHTKDCEARLTGYLYLVLSELIEGAKGIYEMRTNNLNNSEHYINKAIVYMQGNYSRDITIKEISDYIGLDRSYFGAIFKKHTTISPQRFLLLLRINKACELLSLKKLSIGDIARSVGYSDQLLFSKMFKKIKGSSPITYRNATI